MADETHPLETKKRKHRQGRSRRNKKDVILDLTKRRFANNKRPEDQQQPAPLKVKRRKFETTGQYLRRIDRLVAIAKVEAVMETKISGLRDDVSTTGSTDNNLSSRKGSSAPGQTKQNRGPARIGVKAKK